MKRTVRTVGIVMSVVLTGLTVFAQDYERKMFKDKNGELPYRTLKPATVEESKQYPLILLLHGAGERGNDNKRQLRWGGKDILKHSKTNPCFAIIPQCPKGKRWVEVNWSLKEHSMPKEPSIPMSQLFKLLDTFIKENPVDSSRIYVMGLSMGGFGTWDIISRRPDFFAAAVPICGGADIAQASKLIHIPIWCFYGDRDPVVMPKRSRDMVAAIKKAGGTKIKYTEFKNVGHNSWTPAFNTAELWPWLFSQSK